MRTFTAVAAAALAAALLAPATSLAGGFATVGLSSFPEDVSPGDEWVVDLTVLQHGVAPLEGVHPRVLIVPAGSGAGEAFAAEPTKRAGVYRARVGFDSAGYYRVRVDDDFSYVHEFGAVRVGDGGDSAVTAVASSRTGSGPSLLAALGIAALAGLLAATFAAAWGRRASPAAG